MLPCFLDLYWSCNFFQSFRKSDHFIFLKERPIKSFKPCIFFLLCTFCCAEISFRFSSFFIFMWSLNSTARRSLENLIYFFNTLFFSFNKGSQSSQMLNVVWTRAATRELCAVNISLIWQRFDWNHCGSDESKQDHKSELNADFCCSFFFSPWSIWYVLVNNKNKYWDLKPSPRT